MKITRPETTRPTFITGLIFGAMIGGAFVALGIAFLTGPLIR